MNAGGLFTHRSVVNTWEGVGACQCAGTLVSCGTSYDPGLKRVGKEPVVGHFECSACHEHLEVRQTGLERYPVGGFRPTR